MQLTECEADSSRSQIVTLKKGRGHNIKCLPMAFTEHGAIPSLMGPAAADSSRINGRGCTRNLQVHRSAQCDPTGLIAGTGRPGANEAILDLFQSLYRMAIHSTLIRTFIHKGLERFFAPRRHERIQHA